MRPTTAPIWFVPLMICAAAAAQPASVTRVLYTFDFEERRLGNVEELPMNWVKVDGPSLPHYVNGRLTTDARRGGEYSFRFDLNGGGLIYRYPSGRIKVQTGAHYRVAAWVRTTSLKSARARVAAYFADQDGNRLESTTRHSATYAAPRDGDDSWTLLSVELSADDPAIHSLVIELGLLQPMHFAPHPLGERTLLTQDIYGTAWFDDVTVSQVPQVRLTTNRPGNIFLSSDPLCLDVQVSDRFVDDLAAQLVVTDARGHPVHQRTSGLSMSSGDNVGPGRRRMSVELPDLPPGWYSAALVLTSAGQFVGKHEIQIVRLADDCARVTPDDRFGIIATDLPIQSWGDLPDILPIVGAGRVKLPVWTRDGDIQEVDSAAFDRLIERLAEARIEPTACLVELPLGIAKHLSTGAWVELLDAGPELWQPQLAQLVARHANHLTRWQLGADGSDAFVNDRRMREVYACVLREFAMLVGSPDLAMPWPAWYELEGELPATIALHIKPEVLPSQLPLYVRDLHGHEGKNLSLFIEPVDRERYGREVQIRDLAQRMIFALSADVRRIDVKLPFDIAPDGSQMQPRELLMIVRTLMTTLSGATYRGRVPVADGVEAFLFDRHGQGIVALWDRGDENVVKQLAINLTESAAKIDLWGNVTPLLRSAAERDTASARVEVGPTPVFLVGVDAELAQLRASVALDNPLLESGFKAHSRKLRFTNPYRQAISGSFKLHAPQGWVINPPTGTFSLNPDEVFERELTIEFPYNSFAGTKTITADFKIQADVNSSLSVPVMLKLGLSDVGLQSLALRDGDDVIVQQMITNYGDKPIDYTAFALYPGQARQERLVTNLAPGRTTIKKYRFSNVKFFPGAKVRSGLRELVGDRILNDEVVIQ